MGSLKVWDGSSWQTVSQQGTGLVTIPAGGSPGATLSKQSGADYDMTWDGANWTAYTPQWVTSGQPTGAGLSLGTGPGVGIQGWYRMIAPYTMVVRVRFQWGSSGGNGGTGQHYLGLPSGYSTPGDIYQIINGWVGTNDGFYYVGIGQISPGDVRWACNTQWHGLQDRYVGAEFPVHTDGTPLPTNFYPSGWSSWWGTINVAQRW